MVTLSRLLSSPVILALAIGRGSGGPHLSKFMAAELELGGVSQILSLLSVMEENG